MRAFSNPTADQRRFAKAGGRGDEGEPEGYVRTFVDRGAPMAQLLSEAAARGIMPDYTSMPLAAFADGDRGAARRTATGSGAVKR